MNNQTPLQKWLQKNATTSKQKSNVLERKYINIEFFSYYR